MRITAHFISDNQLITVISKPCVDEKPGNVLSLRKTIIKIQKYEFVKGLGSNNLQREVVE
jgi:hypothetical protein